MITTNVFMRVFRILYSEEIGTAFTIDAEGKQYLVTAKHVIPDLTGESTVSVQVRGVWHPLRVSLVGHAEGDIDISVLAVPEEQLSPQYALPATSVGVALAQDAYFLGFPYGHFIDIGETNHRFPVPFVKKAIVSGNAHVPGGPRVWYLDGINNPGFSGGPVVWQPMGRREWHVLAVVSGFQRTDEPVFHKNEPTPFAYRYNTGIIISYDIQHALELIARNPIGRVVGT